MITASNINGMNMYLATELNIAKEEGYEDPITLEKLSILEESSHPRGSIAIRRKNSKPYFYNVKTIVRIIEDGDGKDPFTRQKFDKITMERAYMYYELLLKFPDLKKENINYKSIYNDWMTEPNNQNKRLKARCLLQPSDLQNMFREYNGKGCLQSRSKAILELKEKSVGSWILRNSSVKDTETIKCYCLTVKTANGFKHNLVVHKYGAGVYFSVVFNRQEKITENFKYGKSYPNIIDLIEDQCL